VEYIHVKNLDKYHPGYKDRALIWCKAYFKMINADPDFEMLPEIDKWRYIAFIMLELQTQKPIPLNPEYLKRKGFDLKKRSISKTINMLRNFVSSVTEEGESCVVEKRREEKRREEEEYSGIQKKWNDFANKNDLPKIRELSKTRIGKINARLKEKDFDLDLLFKNIEEQPFLLGENKQGWTIDFDWVFQKNNYLKIMEMKYKNRKKAGTMTPEEQKAYDEMWGKER